MVRKRDESKSIWILVVRACRFSAEVSFGELPSFGLNLFGDCVDECRRFSESLPSL